MNGPHLEITVTREPVERVIDGVAKYVPGPDAELVVTGRAEVVQPFIGIVCRYAAEHREELWPTETEQGPTREVRADARPDHTFTIRDEAETLTIPAGDLNLESPLEVAIDRLRDGLEHLRDANMVPHGPDEVELRDFVSERAAMLLERLSDVEGAITEELEARDEHAAITFTPDEAKAVLRIALLMVAWHEHGERTGGDDLLFAWAVEAVQIATGTEPDDA